MTFATLAEAITWLRSTWTEQRPVPTKLHTHETEGVGLFYAPGFIAALSSGPDTVVSMKGPTTCYHPQLPIGRSLRDCPECFGMGVKEHQTDRYVYPMSLALTKLKHSPSLPRQPHPYLLVHQLAMHDFRARPAAVSLSIHWDRAEPLFLMAIRKLHGRYSAGPTPTRTSAATWVDLSESQRNAETAA